MQTEIRRFYESVVEPFLSSPSVDLRGYHHAYSLVTSRAFLVDGYHGLSMVPIADRLVLVPGLGSSRWVIDVPAVSPCKLPVGRSFS